MNLTSDPRASCWQLLPLVSRDPLTVLSIMNVVSLERRKYLEKQEQLLLYYIHIGKVKIEVAQSCPTLCDPIDCSLPGSSVHGIFQAIVLEGIAISFSRGSSQPRARTQVSRTILLFLKIFYFTGHTRDQTKYH